MAHEHAICSEDLRAPLFQIQFKSVIWNCSPEADAINFAVVYRFYFFHLLESQVLQNPNLLNSLLMEAPLPAINLD